MNEVKMDSQETNKSNAAESPSNRESNVVSYIISQIIVQRFVETLIHHTVDTFPINPINSSVFLKSSIKLLN